MQAFFTTLKIAIKSLSITQKDTIRNTLMTYIHLLFDAEVCDIEEIFNTLSQKLKKSSTFQHSSLLRTITHEHLITCTESELIELCSTMYTDQCELYKNCDILRNLLQKDMTMAEFPIHYYVGVLMKLNSETLYTFGQTIDKKVLQTKFDIVISHMRALMISEYGKMKSTQDPTLPQGQNILHHTDQ